MHIAFDLTQPVSTDDWKSFLAYHDAEDLLDADQSTPDRASLLKEARDKLQDSVRHDPSNFLAWFSLSTVLRKQGNNGAAAQHFEMLSQMIRDSDQSSRLNAYVKAHPEVLDVVLYNLASALSKTDNWDDYKAALGVLTELLSRLDQCPPGHPTQADHSQKNALSSHSREG